MLKTRAKYCKRGKTHGKTQDKTQCKTQNTKHAKETQFDPHTREEGTQDFPGEEQGTIRQ